MPLPPNPNDDRGADHKDGESTDRAEAPSLRPPSSDASPSEPLPYDALISDVPPSEASTASRQMKVTDKSSASDALVSNAPPSEASTVSQQVKLTRESRDSDATQVRGEGVLIPQQPRREEAFRPVLICLSGELRGQRRAIDSRELIIGRGSAADWHIDDGITSRTHALITYENVDDPRSMPRCYVEDMGSRNGTELNGKRIESRTRLVERDRLFLGTTVIGFFVRDSDELQNEMSLYHSATRDPLTGLENRRQLETVVKAIIGRTGKRDRAMAFLLLDLDHFKGVNDTYGHDVGDLALKHVASIIRQSVRDNDTPARWGGEEFAVIMPTVSPRAALRVGENLRRAIESQPLITEKVELTLTASIGITLSNDNDSIDSLFQRADQLLYRAKQSGRNRVEADEAIILGCIASESAPDNRRQ